MAGAAEVLQEVHVETYGALNKKEKADFILEQVTKCNNEAAMKDSYALSPILSTRVLRSPSHDGGGRVVMYVSADGWAMHC